MSLRHSNWIEDFVFPLAVAALTAAWVGLWVLWAARAGLPEVAYPPVSPLLLGLLFAGAALLTRALLERSGELRSERLVIVGGGLAAVAASLWWTYRFASLGGFLGALSDWGRYISPVLLGLVACIYLWWQGIRLAAAPWPQQHLERSLLVAVLGLALLFVVNQSQPVITPGEAVSTTVVVFGAGLGALALVSFENARRYHEGTTGTRLPLNRYWLITVATVVGAILAAALLAATFFSPAAYAGVGAALRAVLDVLTFALVFMLAIVVAAISVVVFPIMQFIMSLYRPEPQEQIEITPPQAAQVAAEEAVRLFADNPALAVARQVLFFVLLVAGVGLLLWWSVRRLNTFGRKDGDELRDSIATRELVWGQLKAFFGRRAESTQALDPYLALAGSDDDPRLIIRRAYQAMLAWARTVTQGRAAGQTPASYGEALARTLPQGRAAIATLTIAYERARYSAEPPSLEEARTAVGALDELQALQAQAANGGSR
jgi:hypothetical protein